MKKFFLLSCFSLICLQLLAQVGVATKEPTATLDINGDLRIRQLPIGNASTDKIFTADEVGNSYDSSTKDVQINEAINTTIKTGDLAVVHEKAEVENERFIPTLDLWTEQELHGSIKDVYFVSLRQRITLPQNTTTLGDDKIRKVVFILMQNNAPEGFDSVTQSQNFDEWRIYFQTKKFEMSSDGEGCYLNDTTFVYEPESSSGLFSPDPAGAYIDESDGERSQLKGRYQDQIRDREFVFYDFGGKWIMSVRD